MATDGRKSLLTHPDFSKAALSKLDVQTKGLSGNLPGIFGQALCLRLQYRTNV